jgi:hypothetical protein
MIIGDKAKSQIYCDIVKLGEQIEETDPKDTKKADELYQQVDKLATKLGPEYMGWNDKWPGEDDCERIVTGTANGPRLPIFKLDALVLENQMPSNHRVR